MSNAERKKVEAVRAAHDPVKSERRYEARRRIAALKEKACDAVMEEILDAYRTNPAAPDAVKAWLAAEAEGDA